MVGPLLQKSKQNTNTKIAPLPANFIATKEETSLLSHYEMIKLYEKEAAKLREKAAKAKLREADEKHRASTTEEIMGVDPSIGKRKRVRNTDDDSGDEYDSIMGSDASDADEEELERRRLRKEKREEAEDLIDAAEKAEKARALEEQQRMMHLAEEDLDAVNEIGPLLKKKVDDRPVASLISTLQAQVTPQHEFSKSLEMRRGGRYGTVLYPTAKDHANAKGWSPPEDAAYPSEGALEIELPNFESSQAALGVGNNTIAIKLLAPLSSKRFSFNIATPNHRDYFDILFHFNPRQFEKGGRLILNDKQEGIWGHGVAIPLNNLPFYIFSKDAITLMVQITGDGFDIILNGRHCARLDHRSRLPTGKCSLFLQFPSTDDYGNLEDLTMYRVWWGHKDIIATDNTVPGSKKPTGNLHPKKLFISSLDRVSTESEADYRKAELERAFRKYGGPSNSGGLPLVIVPLNSTFAFVEVESEKNADLAMTEMVHKYRMNRARRSKHDIMKEEREAAEANIKSLKVEEDDEWD